MEYKLLKKAAITMERIRVLDSEIIQIDKLAMLCAEGKLKSTIELTAHEEKEEKLKLDDDGFIVKPTTDNKPSWHTGGILSFMMDYNTAPKAEENVHVIKTPLSESETFQFLGFLLQLKDTERKVLVKQLKEYGVK